MSHLKNPIRFALKFTPACLTRARGVIGSNCLDTVYWGYLLVFDKVRGLEYIE